MDRIACCGIVERLDRACLDNRLAQIVQVVLKGYADAERTQLSLVRSGANL